MYYVLLVYMLKRLFFVCVCFLYLSCRQFLLNGISLAKLGSLVFLSGPVFANLCAQMYICVAD